jgi:hypothetical protein
MRDDLTFVSCCALLLGGASGARSQAPAAWALSAQPRLVIGSEDEQSALLTSAVGATRLPDGSILVGDNGDYALRHFSATGAPLRTFGRKGSGPGEVTYLVGMLRCGDTVYTRDADNGARISVFTLAGRYVREFRFTGPGAAHPYRSACNAAGVFAHHGWENRSDMRPGVFRSRVPVWLTRSDSGVVRFIDSLPGSERWGIARDGKMAGTGPLPLGKEPVIGIGRNRVFMGSADTYVVQAFDLQGRKVAALQRPGEPIRVTRADFDAFIDRQAAGKSDEVRERIVKGWANVELPKTLPAYTALVTDADDLVWVRGYARPGTAHASWSVFTSGGSFVTEVRLPADLEVYEIGKDYVLGRFLSPDVGTPEIHLYGLVRGPVPRS